MTLIDFKSESMALVLCNGGLKYFFSTFHAQDNF